MACSKPIQSGLQRLIECSICLEVYQHPHKVPKNLQCGHTFCSECLAKLIEENQSNCSKCRRKTLVPNGDVYQLATNFTALDLLETSCEECRNQQWMTRCDHCEKNVCETCHSSHLKLGQSDTQHRLTEAKERIQHIADICDEDNYLKELDDKAETAEEEVIEYWDGVASKVEERKNQDLLKIRNNHKEASDAYIKWKENVQVSVTKAKSTVEKFSSRHGRKYLGPITLEEVENVTQRVEHLLVDLEIDVSQKPDIVGYEMDMTTRVRQPFLENGVVKIICDVQPSISCPVPQYTQASHSMTYGLRPVGVAISPNTGNVVITDETGRLHILTSTFEPVSVSGSEGSGYGQYNNPQGVAVNPNNDQIYVADGNNHRIQVLNKDGSYHSVFDYHGTGTDDDVLQWPKSIAIDKSGLLYVVDTTNYTIKVIHPDGSLIRRFGTYYNGPYHEVFDHTTKDIAVSEDNNKLVVTDTGGDIDVYTTDGKHVWSKQSGQSGSFEGANGVAIDQFGNIIVADSAGQIVVLREDGEVICKIGSCGPAYGQLYYGPNGVALTPEGDIVVADYGNNRVQLFKVPKE